MSNHLSDALEIWGFEKDFTIFADGSLGFALTCTPLDVSSWSTEARDEFAERLRDFLNSLPDRIDIQCVQEISPDTPDTIHDYQKLILDSATNELKELTNFRAERLMEEIENGTLPRHELKILCRRPRTTSELSKVPFLSKAEKFPEILETELEREFLSLEKLRDQLTEGLESLGLTCQNIDSKSLAQIIYRQWNPDRPLDWKRRFENAQLWAG